MFVPSITSIEEVGFTKIKIFIDFSFLISPCLSCNTSIFQYTCMGYCSHALPRRLYSVLRLEPLTNVSVSERLRAGDRPGVEKYKRRRIKARGNEANLS